MLEPQWYNTTYRFKGIFTHNSTNALVKVKDEVFTKTF